MRRPKRQLALATLVVLAAMAWAGCGFVVERRAVPKLPSAPMKTATLQQLVASFNHNANAIRSLEMKMALTVSSGGPRKGEVDKLKLTFTTYLYIQKPDDIRFYGNYTAIGKVFDLASNGVQFEVSRPSSDVFYRGHVDAPPAKDASPIEKLRPAVILDSMLINPIRMDNGDHVVPINDRAETNAEYGVLVHRPNPDGFDQVLRRIVFSRYDLLPSRQIIYDQNGFPATTVSYARYVNIQGIPVPTQITINRPAEEYTMAFKVDPTHVLINPPDRPADFWQITPPAGYKVVDLDSADSGGSVK